MPQAPLGSIEFIIRADSMKTSFEDAVKKALQSQNININFSDISKSIEDVVSDIGGEDIDHIKDAVDEIRNELLIRLRTTISPENEKSALLNLRAEIMRAKEEKTKERLTKAFKSSEVGQSMVPEGMSEEEFAERYQERYLEVMSQFLESGSWKSNIRKIKSWRGMLEDFLSGKQRFRGKELLKQMTGETEYETELRETLKSKYDIETLPQKTWAGIKKDIEKGNKKTITNTDETLEAIEEIGNKMRKEKDLDEKEFGKAMRDIFGTKAVKGEGLAKDIIDEFWSTYDVKKGTKVLPRPLMKALGEEEQEEFFYPKTLLGRRPDMPHYISKESITEGGWRKLFEEQEKGKMADKIQDYIKENKLPGAMTFGVLKTLFSPSTMVKRESEMGTKQGSWRLQPFGWGGKKAIALKREGEEPITKKKMKKLLDEYEKKRGEITKEALRTAVNKLRDKTITDEDLEDLHRWFNQNLDNQK